MNDESGGELGRREFLGLMGAAGAGLVAGAGLRSIEDDSTAGSSTTIPFHGVHQAGIANSQQQFLHFASFDILSDKRDDITTLLRLWSRTAEMLTAGEMVTVENPSAGGPSDSGETKDLGPNRLTLTFGFGPTFFGRGGVDRFGISDRRPNGAIDLPPFKSDDLNPDSSGGDMCVQACAENPQVAFHAVRMLLHVAGNLAVLRWSQRGFAPTSTTTAGDETPRNLFGQKDGTNNLHTGSPDFDANVWVQRDDDQEWLENGTYLVARRIRMALDLWDRTPLDAQERVLGRFKSTGAPFGSKNEHDAPDLTAKNPDGSLVIPPDAHIRLASSRENSGTRIFRRGYSFDDGVDDIQKLDVGLFFICFQRHPEQFITLQQRLSDGDAMHHFLRHTGSAVFVCPPGIGAGSWIGESLFS